ncbi:winged helix-turn-helix transcriptional regulator [Sphingobacterium sp. IITKGP-BTPF85]
MEYELTQSGESFKTVLESMIEWGLQHSELTSIQNSLIEYARV